MYVKHSLNKHTRITYEEEEAHTNPWILLSVCCKSTDQREYQQSYLCVRAEICIDFRMYIDRTPWCSADEVEIGTKVANEASHTISEHDPIIIILVLIN